MDIQPLDQNTIDEVIKRLVKTYNPQEIYILEPKNDDYTIDVNILVVVENANLQQRYALMAEGHKAIIGIKVAKKILVYTPGEFAEYSQDPSTLSYLIKKNGKRIYAYA